MAQEKHLTPKNYAVIFAALLVLTGLTVGVSQMPVGATVHLLFGLSIAVIKATLVVLFFMHMLYSPRLTWLVALGSLVWLAILIFLTLNDYFFRNWDSTLVPQ
jgi:cytochrome c oxidase subunit 4